MGEGVILPMLTYMGSYAGISGIYIVFALHANAQILPYILKQ